MPISPELRLTYQREDEFMGKLHGTLQSDSFAGQGSAWFDQTNIKRKFLTELKKFPIANEDFPKLEGGYWSKDQSGTLDQCHFHISIQPVDLRGSLSVQVKLATPDEENWPHSVSAKFAINYASIDSFASELEQVLDGQRDFALLKGT